MVQAGLPGEVPSYAAWSEDGCQVEEFTSGEPYRTPKIHGQERREQGKLEVLVDYFKHSSFLQEQARHLQLLEEEARFLRTELRKVSAHKSFGNAETIDYESSRELDQDVKLRYAASNSDTAQEREVPIDAMTHRRHAPPASELPSANRLRINTVPTFPDVVDEIPLNDQKVEIPTRLISPESVEVAAAPTDSQRRRFNSFWDSRDSATPKHNAVFADVEVMKEKVREAIAQKPYRVEDLYKENGFPQSIARSYMFEILTLVIIAINSVWISIDIDLNKSDSILEAKAPFIIVENFFLLFFVFELTMRFLAFERKRDCLGDAWFVFDSSLVTLMFIDTYMLPLWLKISTFKGAGDTSILKLVRMTRISRMARMARLLKAFPELTILIKGIWVAARSVFFTLCLLTIIIYIFAVAFRQLTDDQEIGTKYFSTVPDSMKSLLLYGVLPDQAEIVNNVSRQHFLLGILSLIFILLASLTVMNMLVGVLVEVVSVVSSVEKEELKVNFVMSRLRFMLENTGLDANHDMKISRKELDTLLLDPTAARIIKDVGVDPVGLVDFGDYIFQDADDGLSFPQFIDIILQFRGSNNATVKDVVDLRKVALTKMVELRQDLTAQTLLLKDLTRMLKGSNGDSRLCPAICDSQKPRPPSLQCPGPPKLTVPREMKVEQNR
mmetsp:Transcript_105965/g.167240  ORF Transcript_105965/g.167240 Transcript_105965/m.167240 type:complete len:668 (-) Transcript_105965:51-2054(-)